jgi:TonB family protein
MRIELVLAMVLCVGTSIDLRADEYPVSGVWAAMDGPQQNDLAASCDSFSKNPKSPMGHIVVFNGSIRVDFNGGYFEKETVRNIAVRKNGPNEFLVTDSYYYDGGEGGGQSGQKRRSYKLRLLAPDTIETKEAKYPVLRFVRCSATALTTLNPTKQTNNVDTEIVAQYGARLVEYVQKFRQYPATAKERHAEGRAVVKFTVGREGKVLSSEISVSSGSLDLDQEALAMLMRAQPLPPFPADIPEKTKTYSLPVIFNSIEARRLRLGTGNATNSALVLVEPDRLFGAVGEWKISTARFGIGCVAVYSYDDVRSISIGGEAPNKLAIIVEADGRLFDGGLDDNVQSIEIVLGNWRKDDLRPYGYRGTSGVVADFGSALSRAFLEASSLKLTDRGSVKLDVPLKQSKQMMDLLTDCFFKAQPLAPANGANQSSDLKSSSSKGLPKKVGQCVETSISAVTDRFGQKLSLSPSKDGFDPGTAIKYTNGGFQISYEKEAAIIRSSIGDKVKMCLVEIPTDCPAGDDRGRVYNTKNLRTGEAWTLADAQHRCGGA